MNGNNLILAGLVGLVPLILAFPYMLDPAFKRAPAGVRKTTDVWATILFLGMLWVWFSFCLPFIAFTKSEVATGATALISTLTLAILGILRLLLLGHITRTLIRHRAEDAEDATFSASA